MSNTPAYNGTSLINYGRKKFLSHAQMYTLSENFFKEICSHLLNKLDHFTLVNFFTILKGYGLKNRVFKFTT